MKKILTLLLILALSVSVFAGCVKIKEVLPDSIKDKFLYALVSGKEMRG